MKYHRIFNFDSKWDPCGSNNLLLYCATLSWYVKRIEGKIPIKFFILSQLLFKPKLHYLVYLFLVYLCIKINNKVAFLQFPEEPFMLKKSEHGAEWALTENEWFALLVYTLIYLLKSIKRNKNYYHLEINLSQSFS